MSIGLYKLSRKFHKNGLKIKKYHKNYEFFINGVLTLGMDFDIIKVKIRKKDVSPMATEEVIIK